MDSRVKVAAMTIAASDAAAFKDGISLASVPAATPLHSQLSVMFDDVLEILHGVHSTPAINQCSLRVCCGSCVVMILVYVSTAVHCLPKGATGLFLDRLDACSVVIRRN
jgi:hypothetical protein